jgi:hypothetical protein
LRALQLPPLKEHAQWLYRIQREHPAAVLFAVRSGRRTGGASIVLPLTAWAFRRVLRGEASAFELSPDDLQSPTKYVMVLAQHDRDRSSRRTYPNSLALLRVTVWQCAYVTRYLDPYRPVGITFGATPLFVRRLEGHGYRNTGLRMRGTRIPLYRYEKIDLRSAAFPSDALSVKRLRRLFLETFEDGALPDGYGHFFFPAATEKPDHLMRLTELISAARARRLLPLPGP